MRRRRCRYCRRLFRPDPRVKGRQFACSDAPCQERRRIDTQGKWRAQAKNRGYFRERYPNLKEWLARPENADYLRRYRRKKRGERAPAQAPPPAASAPATTPTPAGHSTVQQQLADIQDELRSLSRSVSGIQAKLAPGDIQDQLGAKTGSGGGS